MYSEMNLCRKTKFCTVNQFDIHVHGVYIYIQIRVFLLLN